MSALLPFAAAMADFRAANAAVLASFIAWRAVDSVVVRAAEAVITHCLYGVGGTGVCGVFELANAVAASPKTATAVSDITTYFFIV